MGRTARRSGQRQHVALLRTAAGRVSRPRGRTGAGLAVAAGTRRPARSPLAGGGPRSAWQSWRGRQRSSRLEEGPRPDGTERVFGPAGAQCPGLAPLARRRYEPGSLAGRAGAPLGGALRCVALVARIVREHAGRRATKGAVL